MRTLLTATAVVLLVSLGCKKKKETAPIEKLPPETQTGAGTFGCLVNGKAFLPGGSTLSGGALAAQYQHLSEGYFFNLTARNDRGANILGVSLSTDSLELQQGVTYRLDSAQRKGSASGSHFNGAAGNSIIYWAFSTNGQLATGEMTITKFDPARQIISGTFWFDAINEAGQKVEIRSGRFDVRYTR